MHSPLLLLWCPSSRCPSISVFLPLAPDAVQLEDATGDVSVGRLWLLLASLGIQSQAGAVWGIFRDSSGVSDGLALELGIIPESLTSSARPASQ